MTRVFFLGSHPALSAAELAAWAERNKIFATWDISRLPVALLANEANLEAGEMQGALGGTTMIGTLRATSAKFPDPNILLDAVPEITTPKLGKRIVGLSAFPMPRAPHNDKDHILAGATANLTARVRELAMNLKHALGLKGTRVVFPPSGKPYLSTAQLLHNRLPRDGVDIALIVGAHGVDVVKVESIQDIEAYARRDRARPEADPGRGMLPPKVAQILLNLSLVPPSGAVYDPFCGVGTIPTEALLMGLKVYASDISPTQAERTRKNLAWAERTLNLSSVASRVPMVREHDIARKVPEFVNAPVDAVVTEGWLGQARTSVPSPGEMDATFTQVAGLVNSLMRNTTNTVCQGGRLILALPAFRVKKRLLRFPLERLRSPSWKPESLVPEAWTSHSVFRDAARGTLLYGRPDALVMREFVRFRRHN